MLRNALLAFGVLLVLAGVVGALVTHALPGVLVALWGAILVLLILIERRHYKPIVNQVPGPDWHPTGERSREPGSDVLVEVYYQPRTGRRVYVRLT